MPLEMEGLGLEGMREIIGWLGEKRLTIIRRGLPDGCTVTPSSSSHTEEPQGTPNTRAWGIKYKGVERSVAYFCSRILDIVRINPQPGKDIATLAREGFSKPAANSLEIAHSRTCNQTMLHHSPNLWNCPGRP